MSDKVFLDTNILIYFYSENEESKRNAAHRLLVSYANNPNLKYMTRLYAD